VRGRTVRRLPLGAEHSETARVLWDGRDDRGRAVSAGVYYYRFESGGESRSGKLIRLR
jgi:flagellar hook assembly protein FlgD